MKTLLLYLIACPVPSLFLNGCAAQSTLQSGAPSVSVARIAQRGLIACFEEGLKTSEGESVQCETSAVVYTPIPRIT